MLDLSENWIWQRRGPGACKKRRCRPIQQVLSLKGGWKAVTAVPQIGRIRSSDTGRSNPTPVSHTPRASLKNKFRTEALCTGFGTTTSERCAELTVLMREIEDWLWQIRGVDDASNFDGAFVFNKLSHGLEEVW